MLQEIKTGDLYKVVYKEYYYTQLENIKTKARIILHNIELKELFKVVITPKKIKQ